MNIRLTFSLARTWSFYARPVSGSNGDAREGQAEIDAALQEHPAEIVHLVAVTLIRFHRRRACRQERREPVDGAPKGSEWSASPWEERWWESHAQDRA